MSQTTRRNVIFVLTAILTGLALSLLYLLRSDGVSPDSYEYLRGGVAFWRGEGFRNMSGGWQLTFPPFYSLIIGGVDNLLHNPLLAGRLTSVFASTLSILFFYFLARIVAPGLPAVIGAWLFALLPLRINLSTMVWSESVFFAVVLGGLLLWILSPARLWVSVFAGLVLGAAFLTRPEGFFIFLICIIGTGLLAINESRRLSFRGLRILLLILGFSIAAFPYLYYLHRHTGHWQLSGKTKFNLAVAAPKTEGVTWERLRVLSEDDREIQAIQTQENPLEFAKRYVLNSQQELLALAKIVSPFLLVCIGLALPAGIAVWRKRAALFSTIFFAVGCPLLIVPAFFLQDRFLALAALLPILLALPALGTEQDSENKVLAGGRKKIGGLLVTLVFLWFLVSTGALIKTAESGLPKAMKPLLSGLEKAPGRGAIVGSFILPKALAFETGREWRPLPWADLDRVLNYSLQQEAGFLLIQGRDNPELVAFADSRSTRPDLVAIAEVEIQDANGKHLTRLYRIGEAK